MHGATIKIILNHLYFIFNNITFRKTALFCTPLMQINYSFSFFNTVRNKNKN